MKRKISIREMVMVSIVALAVFGYGFYSFIWVPMKAEETRLIEEKESLKSELSSKKVEDLEQKKSGLEEESNAIDLKIEQVKSEKEFGAKDYQELLTYLGGKADDIGVDMTAFEKLPFSDQKNYWEVPYEVSVQGDYDNIIQFVNSVFELENYFYITHMDMRQVSRIPMTDKTVEGQSSLQNQILFEWAPEFLNELDEEIPSELRSDLEQEYRDEFREAMAVMEEEKKNSFKIDKKLQLTFTFHFISLEEPKE